MQTSYEISSVMRWAIIVESANTTQVDGQMVPIHVFGTFF